MARIATGKRDSIPTYRANGRRVSDSSEERAERLLALKLVVVRRDRQGRIRLIQFKSDCGRDALTKNPPLGTRYSYEESLESGHVWAHRDLRNVERIDFEQVPLSCCSIQPPQQQKAEVVDIGEWRKRTTQMSGETERMAA